MKKLRVLVLLHADLRPPEDAESRPDSEQINWESEYDVITTLKQLGHEVEVVGVSYDLGVLRDALLKFKPHITFNLLEEFYDVGTYDQHIVAYLELMTQAYTGCNPRGLMLTHDKVLAKKILHYHRLRTPRFWHVPRNKKFRMRKDLAFPLLVKSAVEDASLGIAQASVVRSEPKLVERVQYVQESLKSDVLVEEYIEGRELYVGVLGNTRLETLPIWEMDFSNLPDRTIPIATSKVKWDVKYQEQNKIVTGPAKDLDPALVRRIEEFCKRAYRRLYMSGYGRMDLRLRDDGEVFLLEANANPNLSFSEDFASAAEESGMSRPELVQKILTLGLSYQAEWKAINVG